MSIIMCEAQHIVMTYTIINATLKKFHKIISNIFTCWHDTFVVGALMAIIYELSVKYCTVLLLMSAFQSVVYQQTSNNLQNWSFLEDSYVALA